MNVGQCFNTQPLATSHKYCDTTPFFLKKYAYSPPTSHIQCWESVKIVSNCSDGCLVHLAGLKLKNSTLKLGVGRGFVPFVWRVIVWKSKIILTGIYLSRCFQTFSNKLKNELHPLHAASTGSSNLKRCVIFWFYIAIFIIALSYNV